MYGFMAVRKTLYNIEVNMVRDVQSAGGAPKGCDKELRLLFGRTLMPSILDKAFKGEL